jgi:mono/diheme cytochrome c family protein
MHKTRWPWTLATLTLIAGCLSANDPKTSKAADDPSTLTAGVRVSPEGIIDFGTTVFAENPTTLLERSDFHGYAFDGRTGGVVTITMNSGSATCGALDTVVVLFGPEDANGNRGTAFAENDDAFIAGACSLDSRIANFQLPVDGMYLIVATSVNQDGGGHYKLSLTCNNGACALPDSPTFAGTRINQADIDRGLLTPAALFDIGDFMFGHVFTAPEGLGNALIGTPAGNSPRPNFRQSPNNVHFAAFGAPEAQSCVTCHPIPGFGASPTGGVYQGGGPYGGGDIRRNIFQIGDGINRLSGLPRNPPAIFGDGYRQQIGIEMTADLAAQVAAAKAQAASTHLAVTKALSSKGISFGSLIANVDGTVNTAGVVGVDADLIVKPFGWKGREATLRRAVEGGFRVHFGMQSQPSIVKHCATPNVNTFGTGTNCQDPDADGVTNEITEGQLSVMAVHIGLLETPVRVPAVTPAAQTRANSGEALFNSVGCASCHVRNMKLNTPIHVEPADTTGGAGIQLNLAVDNKDPHPALAADGSMTIEVFSDFKRHDVGAALADSKNFNQIAANQFITPPLWGIAVSAPYLHDGRAPTLADATLAHAGDALAVRNAYAALTADQQLQIQEFLLTLGLQENKDAGPVDLSNFIVEQTGFVIDAFLPAGTLIPHGGYAVIARNATKAQFEAFYGKTLGPNVLFFNGNNTFPIIDGSETFALLDLQGVFMDGRSLAEPVGGQRTLSRKNCGVAAPLATSWTTAVTTTAGATPGKGPLSTGQGRICITEVADALNSNFEFIEIFVE